jgi:hypothetical protein
VADPTLQRVSARVGQPRRRGLAAKAHDPALIDDQMG